MPYLYRTPGKTSLHLSPATSADDMIPCTYRLWDFATERGGVEPDEWDSPNGIANLHPDIRWCPADVVPE